MGNVMRWEFRDYNGNVIISGIIPIVNGSIKGSIGSNQIKPLSPITTTESASGKPSLKEAEDKISKWFQDQKEAEREAIKALVYRILYNEGLRINRAEQVITKSFKV